MRLLPGLLLLLLLAGCDTRRPATETTRPARPIAGVAPAAELAAAAPARPDTVDYARADRGNFDNTRPDTLIQLGPRHYWLRMTQVSDSTRPLEFEPAGVVGRYHAAPSDTAWLRHRVRGYEGTYTFTLRDSTHRAVVFSTRLHKRDLFKPFYGEVLVVSEPSFRYLGYSAGLQALLFQVYVGIPYSDVVDRGALLLDARTGRPRGLYGIGSASFERSDCDPQVSASGRAVLTCAGQLLRAGRPALSLRRPHAELRAARFLTDTTLLAVYQFGDYRPARLRDEAGEASPSPVADAAITANMSQPITEFTSTPAQQRQPNAFVLTTSGRQLARFRYDGWLADMGYTITRRFGVPTRTYYLLNGEAGASRSLVLLPKAYPDSAIQLPLSRLPRFRPPRQPQEVPLILRADDTEYVLYLDTTNLRRVRYTRRPARD